jgi:hypothetical protein
MSESQKQDLEQSQTSRHSAGEDEFSHSENLSSHAPSPPEGLWPDESNDPVWAELVGDEDDQSEDDAVPERFLEDVRRARPRGEGNAANESNRASQRQTRVFGRS